MTIEHNAITDPNIHEPKGIAAAIANKVYVSDGAGSGDWTVLNNNEMGWYDYNDLATQSTAIPLTTAGTAYALTNDGDGPYTTTTYKLLGVDNIWNVSTNRFDLSGLFIGDVIDIRVDITAITTTANTALDIDIVLAEGHANEFSIPILTTDNKKTSGTYRIIRSVPFYIGSQPVIDNPGKITTTADTTGCTIKVNGWFVRVIRRN